MPKTAAVRDRRKEGLAEVFRYWMEQTPDSQIIEIIEGELVMSPASRAHMVVHRSLFRAIDNFVLEHNLGQVLYAPYPVKVSQDTFLEPDIQYIRSERAHLAGAQFMEGPPDLVIEILSPSTERRDRVTKFSAYATFGVTEYWLVDTDDGVIEVYGLNDGAYHLTGSYSGQDKVKSAVLEGLEIVPGEVFKGVV